MTGMKLNELCFLVLVMSTYLLFWYLWHSPIIVKDNQNANKVVYEANEEKPEHSEEINYKEIFAQEKEKDYLDITKPTIVYWTDDYHFSNYMHVHSFGELKCDVIMNNYRKRLLPPECKGAYIFYGSSINFTSLPLPRNPEKVIWVLLHEESPKMVWQLSHEKVLNLFNFSSTFSRYSDIPLTLQYLKSIEYITDRKYFVETSAKNKALEAQSPILYMQSICNTMTQRDEYVSELMKYQSIDSYGDCLKNKHSPEFSKRQGYNYVDMHNMWDDNVMKFIARYKFMITIENGVCDDYISEKIWRAIHAGVVPIYFGSPTVRDWLPNEKSAILIEDFPKPKLLSHHLNKLLDDDASYEEYLEHKTMGKISNKNLVNEIKSRPYQTSQTSSMVKLLDFVCEELHKKDNSVNIVTQRHYNCSKPVTVLTQKEDPSSIWFGTWLYGGESAANLYEAIMQ